MNIPDEVVEAAAKAACDSTTHLKWDDLHELDRELCRRLSRAALEAAAPHMFSAKVAEVKANNDHIVEGGDGYSAGFHFALHCIHTDDDPKS